jgi:hypothetical protein
MINPVATSDYLPSESTSFERMKVQFHRAIDIVGNRCYRIYKSKVFRILFIAGVSAALIFGPLGWVFAGITAGIYIQAALISLIGIGLLSYGWRKQRKINYELQTMLRDLKKCKDFIIRKKVTIHVNATGKRHSRGEQSDPKLIVSNDARENLDIHQLDTAANQIAENLKQNKDTKAPRRSSAAYLMKYLDMPTNQAARRIDDIPDPFFPNSLTACYPEECSEFERSLLPYDDHLSTLAQPVKNEVLTFLKLNEKDNLLEINDSEARLTSTGVLFFKKFHQAVDTYGSRAVRLALVSDPYLFSRYYQVMSWEEQIAILPMLSASNGNYSAVFYHLENYPLRETLFDFGTHAQQRLYRWLNVV